jgi:hypothetical protein
MFSGRSNREEKATPVRCVNLGVDTPWELMENTALSRLEGLGAERHYAIRVLGKPNRTPPTGKFLDELRHNKNELAGLLAKVRGLLRSPRKDHWRFCKEGRGVGKGIFEFKAKGKEFRLFFFYGEDVGRESALVITTHGFSKAKSSTDEQDREFRRAARIRAEYLDQGGTYETS